MVESSKLETPTKEVKSTVTSSPRSENSPKVGDGQWMCTNCKFINTVLNFANVDEAKCEICQSINQEILDKINEHIKVKTSELSK